MQTAGRRCRAAFGLLAVVAYSGFERNRDDGEGTRRSTPDKAERPNFSLSNEWYCDLDWGQPIGLPKARASLSLLDSQLTDNNNWYIRQSPQCRNELILTREDQAQHLWFQA